MYSKHRILLLTCVVVMIPSTTADQSPGSHTCVLILWMHGDCRRKNFKQLVQLTLELCDGERERMWFSSPAFSCLAMRLSVGALPHLLQMFEGVYCRRLGMAGRKRTVSLTTQLPWFLPWADPLRALNGAVFPWGKKYVIMSLKTLTFFNVISHPLSFNMLSGKQNRIGSLLDCSQIYSLSYFISLLMWIWRH